MTDLFLHLVAVTRELKDALADAATPSDQDALLFACHLVAVQASATLHPDVSQSATACVIT